VPSEGIKIGWVGPLSGNAVSYGEPILRGSLLAVEELNARGGIAGVPVELIAEDGKCEGESATAAVNKLLSVDGVKYVIGGTCSGETLAMAPVTESSGALLLSPSATSPDVTNAGALVFRTISSDAFAGTVAAAYAYNEVGARKAAVISETTDYAQGLKNTFVDGFLALGGEVMVNETYDTGDVTFSDQMLKVKDAAPDVVYIVPQTASAGVLVVADLKGANFSGTIISTETMASEKTLNDNATDMNGVVVIEPYYDVKVGLAAAFLASFKEKYGVGPEYPFFAASAYSDVYLLAEAMEEVGYDTSAVAAYLLQLEDWSHALGTVSFDENGDIGAPYLVKQAVSGAWNEVKVVSP
jgi:branched-chain amino acid transport system substrate-binding protein